MSSISGSALAEQSLAAALMKLTRIAWVGVQATPPGSRRRFDMAFRDDESVVLVEYDGDEHYRNSLKIKADHAKETFAAAHGARLVRIPYWLQPDDDVARFFFWLDPRISTTFLAVLSPLDSSRHPSANSPSSVSRASCPPSPDWYAAMLTAPCEIDRSSTGSLTSCRPDCDGSRTSRPSDEEQAGSHATDRVLVPEESARG